jgi:hypothetical protein
LVYGSAERGFSAFDTHYAYDAGRDGLKNSPPNLLLETPAPASSIRLPVDLWRAYYRVAAVDAAGQESGSSDLAELPHPLIVTQQLPSGKASSYYQAEVRFRLHRPPGFGRRERQAYQMKFRTETS